MPGTCYSINGSYGYIMCYLIRRSNQSILKGVSPGCSLEGLMLKLKLQYFGHLMQRFDSLEKTLRLVAGGEGDDRGWDGWKASPTPWTWVWVDSGSWWWTGRPGVLWFTGSQRVRRDWTELSPYYEIYHAWCYGIRERRRHGPCRGLYRLLEERRYQSKLRTWVKEE